MAEKKNDCGCGCGASKEKNLKGVTDKKTAKKNK